MGNGTTDSYPQDTCAQLETALVTWGTGESVTALGDGGTPRRQDRNQRFLFGEEVGVGYSHQIAIAVSM